MTIWYILYSFRTFFSGFGIICQEKSVNPVEDHSSQKIIRRQPGQAPFSGPFSSVCSSKASIELPPLFSFGISYLIYHLP
jgi:hypothetical protein